MENSINFFLETFPNAVHNNIVIKCTEVPNYYNIVLMLEIDIWQTAYQSIYDDSDNNWLLFVITPPQSTAISCEAATTCRPQIIHHQIGRKKTILFIVSKLSFSFPFQFLY